MAEEKTPELIDEFERQLTIIETEQVMLGDQCKFCLGHGYDDIDVYGNPLPCSSCSGSGREMSEEDWVEYYREYDEKHGIR
jgi:DnaJ-class molecular chaperone